mmetsp:Transcript_21772/g.36022  ORF Transcript_21772/g.36022 Transcript_21772/m.36022 type:complete len:318 (+) Transcript_21772:20-973(+)
MDCIRSALTLLRLLFLITTVLMVNGHSIAPNGYLVWGEFTSFVASYNNTKFGGHDRLLFSKPKVPSLSADSGTRPHSSMLVRGGQGCPFIAGIQCTNRHPITMWLAPCFAWMLLLRYHLIAKDLQIWKSTWRNSSTRSRALWAMQICETKNTILGVQTLRNALSTAGFLCTTATGIVSVVVSLAYQHSEWSANRVLKYASAIALLAGSALSFIQSMRYLTNVAFLFPVALDPRDPVVTVRKVGSVMIVAHKFWWLGLRCLYVALPSLLWITFGPLAMLGSSLVLLRVLWFLDYFVPHSIDESQVISKVGLQSDSYVI